MKQTAKFLVLLLILSLVNYLLLTHVNAYIVQVIGLIGINIIMVSSLNLITGFTGQFSLGHAGFMAIGAYVSAALSFYFQPDMDIPIVNELLFLFFLLLGGLSASFCGFIIGLPSLRLKGDYLAIVTLGFGEIIRVVILNMNFIGGARGFTNIPERAGFFWIYLCAFLTVLFLWRTVYSVKGLSFSAVREDEIAAESVGIGATRVKVTAFVTGAFLAGIGGGLFAHFNTYLNPSSFTFLKSIEFVAMVVLGGMGSLTGSILSAILLTSLPEFLRVVSDYRMVIYSLLLIVMMIWRPAGIMGFKEWGRNR